jgi:hypothetical protein
LPSFRPIIANLIFNFSSNNKSVLKFFFNTYNYLVDMKKFLVKLNG